MTQNYRVSSEIASCQKIKKGEQMALKRTGKKSLKIISATAMCIFSLFVAFSGAFAWFEANRNVSSTNDNFAIVYSGSPARSISFYQLDNFDSSGYFNFDYDNPVTVTMPTGVETEIEIEDVIHLDEYSADNPHQPLLMLIGVDGSSETIRLQTSSPYITSTGLGEYGINLPLSSVVQFHVVKFAKSGTGSLSDRIDVVDRTQYLKINDSELIDNSTNDGYNFSSFPIMRADGTFNRMQEEIIAFSGDIDDTGYLALMIDYYPVSLSYIYSYFIGNPLLDGSLHFVCDWEIHI